MGLVIGVQIFAKEKSFTVEAADQIPEGDIENELKNNIFAIQGSFMFKWITVTQSTNQC